ncbi:hypothetical protein RJ640_002160 [Escallonia rubra]|uniref:Glycosyl hydrolase family 32 C-terminal domain-containing protein n=1 Tax=Escallonia rubra TaxID=112253 RepID=A0AA88SPB3_9ASTE|nr:hypothetical protein RJ640_002160 [Escallonia rubra]
MMWSAQAKEHTLATNTLKGERIELKFYPNGLAIVLTRETAKPSGSSSPYPVLLIRNLAEHYDKTTYGAFVDVDPVHEKLSLRSLIDHSIVESFGGEGKACISARVYPTLTLDKGAHLYAFNNGIEGVRISQLSAWIMKKAHINGSKLGGSD